MDHEILNRLMVKVTSELSEFIPRNLFHPLGIGITLEKRRLSKEDKERGLPENKERYLSEDEGRGYIASGFAETLFYYPPKDKFLTDRQFVACELLIYLGHLISIETTDPQPPDVITKFLNSFKKYRDYLTEQEAKPFISLLKEGSCDGIKRMTELRAFLSQCFKDGIDKNINSVWLYIQRQAGEPGFHFKTAGKSSATTIADREVTKDKLERCLNAFIKLKDLISK